MATAIEYGLIAAGISIAVVGVINSFPNNSAWDGSLDKKKAAVACAAPHKGDTVIIKGWLQDAAEYRCSNWPKIFNPTYVRNR